MERRNFIQQFGLITGGSLLFPDYLNAIPVGKGESWVRHISSGIESPDVIFPKEKRIPLGWKAFPVSSDGNSSILHFSKPELKSQHIWLRLTAAIDFREEITISAFLSGTGIEIGQFDIRFAHPFQPFQIAVNPEFIDDIVLHGIGLRMTKGKKDVWFFKPDAILTDNLGLQPHLLIGKNKHPEIAFRENLLSMNSFAPFGWIGGCVIDALWEMSKEGNEQALLNLKKQLGLFLNEEKGIIFENPMTEPKNGSFNSIEDFLPFAAIAGLYPKHPAVQMAIDFLKTKENSDGIIAGGNDITTEGCYTVAYPLATIAVIRNNRDLAQTALKQLLFRIDYLSNDTTIFQRSSLNGSQTYANWGRGVAWYLLGMVKTLHVLKESPFYELNEIEKVQIKFQDAIKLVSQWQNPDGLWCSFIDRPETGIDTSASAGIATAITWGIQLGLIDKSKMKMARKTSKSLTNYLTPDGFLTHISQINRGGEQLQASGYRVISQFGMGLFAQLQCQLSQ